MSNQDEETPQAEKTNESNYDFEHYNVEPVIQMVRELGESLVLASRASHQHVIHHFRAEWVDQLIQRYRNQPEKPIIHLDDLNDEIIPILSTGSRELLTPYWDKLASDLGYDGAMNQLRTLRDIVKASKVTRWATLGSWRKLNGLSIRQLEPFVTAIRASNVGTTRVILNPKLPFNLATPWGTKVIGYRGDAAHTTSAFHNLVQELHDDYRTAITNTVGDVPFTTTVRPADDYARTNVGTFITILTSLAGLDNSKKQKAARNPLPSWFFKCSKLARTSGLRALYDAEGSPGIDYVKLPQATIPPDLESELPTWPSKIRYNSLDAASKEKVLSHPPLLLVSTSLLLHQLGIVSYLSPELVSQPKHEASAYWNLTIHRTRNMRLFEELIGFLSPSKANDLHTYNLKHKSSSPSSFFLKRIGAYCFWECS